MEGQQFKYDLHKVDSLHILNYIKEITGKAGSILSPDFMTNLEMRMLFRYGQNLPTIYGYLLASTDSNINRQVIGEHGFFFKRTTIKCDVDFIWHDRKNNMFLFWGGNNYRVVKAMNAIKWRVDKCESERASATARSATGAEIEYDYSDMPELIPCKVYTNSDDGYSDSDIICDSDIITIDSP